MKRHFLWMFALLALAGCASDGDDSIAALKPGLFASSEAPVFAPPTEGQVTTAEAAALAFCDSGVRRLPVVPAPGVLAVAEPFAGSRGCVARQQEDLRAALGLAVGDAFTGRRSALVVTLPQFSELVGALAQCARWNLNSGMVILVLCDRDIRFSTVRISPTSMMAATGLPNREAVPANIYREIQDGLATSEKFNLPFVIRLEIDELQRPVSYSRFAMPAYDRGFQRNVVSGILSPALAVYQDNVLAGKMLGSGEAAVIPPGTPQVPAQLPARFKPAFDLYVPAMSVLGAVKSGDMWVGSEGQVLGLFAFKPYDMVDAVGFDGSALPLAVRAWQNGRRPATAVMNEHDFLRYGEAGLRAAAAEGVPVKLLLLNTGIPEASGADPADSGQLDAILARVPAKVTRISFNQTKGELSDTLKAKLASPDPEVMVVDYR
ncbi:MAG: hypothetical protein AB7F40_10845 [Victivallaceae bacterium]|nr:hypothetical protein [Victivallaceae bacterium]